MSLVCTVFGLKNKGGEPWKGAVVGGTVGTNLKFTIYERETGWLSPWLLGGSPQTLGTSAALLTADPLDPTCGLC